MKIAHVIVTGTLVLGLLTLSASSWANDSCTTRPNNKSLENAMNAQRTTSHYAIEVFYRVDYLTRGQTPCSFIVHIDLVKPAAGPNMLITHRIGDDSVGMLVEAEDGAWHFQWTNLDWTFH